MIPDYLKIGSDLACKCGCGMTAELRVRGMIARLQEALDFELIYTSGARCEEHNAAVGGAANSDHLRGIAVDIACVNPFKRWAIIEKLFQLFVPVGGKGQIGKIEIADKHIHISFFETDAPMMIWGKSK